MQGNAARWRSIRPWLMVAAWYALIFWFSAQSGDVSEWQSRRVEDFAGADTLLMLPVRKWAHVLLFAVQGGLCCRAWRMNGLRGWALPLAAVGLCAALGALDEVHQIFVPERSALVIDAVIDTLSAGAGIVFYLSVRRAITRKRARADSN